MKGWHWRILRAVIEIGVARRLSTATLYEALVESDELRPDQCIAWPTDGPDRDGWVQAQVHWELVNETAGLYEYVLGDGAYAPPLWVRAVRRLVVPS